MQRCEHCDGYVNKGDHTRCQKELFNAAHPFKCPKCSGTGKMNDPNGGFHFEERALPYGETPDCAYSDCRGCHYCINNLKRVSVKNEVRCNLCDGHGRLAKEPIPVTKVVDWKRST